jgi:ribose/xylose/arabinose/galactoside ABC-type transport system permease subunit
VAEVIVSGEMKKIPILGSLLKLVKEYGVALILVIVIGIVSIVSDSFFTITNFKNILNQVAVVGILACGMTFVIISGGIDLSVGSIVSLAGVMSINFVQAFGAIPAIIMVMIIGLLIGLFVGAIMAKIKGRLGESFMITYGMLTVIGAIALIYTNGLYQTGSDYGLFQAFGSGIVPIIVFLVVALLCQLVLKKTIFGRMVYFLGGNEEAARLSGMNTKLFKMIVFAINGMLAALAGSVLVARVGTGSPTAGVGYELDVIAAVVVGGVSMSGGSGNVFNTIFGVLILGVLNNGLNILNVTAYPQMIIKGGIIILAVCLDTWNRRHK